MHVTKIGTSKQWPSQILSFFEAIFDIKSRTNVPKMKKLKVTATDGWIEFASNIPSRQN